MKQEMKQLYGMQLSEKKRELDKLESNLKQTEAKLENFMLNARLIIDGTSLNTRKPTNTSSNAFTEILNVTSSSQNDDSESAARSIPERPVSTWRSSVLQTTGPALKAFEGAVGSYRLPSDYDYDIVHEDEGDVFFDSGQCSYACLVLIIPLEVGIIQTC